MLCMTAACCCYSKGICRMDWLFLTQLFLFFKSFSPSTKQAGYSQL